MPKINSEFALGRIIKVLTASNFITTKAVAAKARISENYIYKLEQDYIINPSDETLTKIATGLELTLEFLQELKQLEQDLEAHLTKQTNIEAEKIDLLILQALAYKVLKHYLSQANCPEDLLTAIKLDSSQTTQANTRAENLQRIIIVLPVAKFITIKTAATNAKISYRTMKNIEYGITNPTKTSLTKIAKSFEIPLEFLFQLEQSEKKLREHFEKQTNIKTEKKDLLILQALAYLLLEYYYNQATSQNYYPKDLLSSPISR